MAVHIYPCCTRCCLQQKADLLICNEAHTFQIDTSQITVIMDVWQCTSILVTRLHKEAVYGKNVDLVICDEAHTLKNDTSQITLAVAALPAARRLLLSGTPVQVSSVLCHK